VHVELITSQYVAVPVTPPARSKSRSSISRCVPLVPVNVRVPPSRSIFPEDWPKSVPLCNWKPVDVVQVTLLLEKIVLPFVSRRPFVPVNDSV
jgi:hypothetical protein